MAGAAVSIVLGLLKYLIAAGTRPGLEAITHVGSNLDKRLG